jgi:hypothetical protein
MSWLEPEQDRKLSDGDRDDPRIGNSLDKARTAVLEADKIIINSEMTGT